MSAIEQALDEVAEDLSWLEAEIVFVGGATIGLFLDALGRAQLRPTVDVDCIVPTVLTQSGWWRLEEQLRRRRWAPDPEGPICRYRSPRGALVDLMPQEPTVLGFAGEWYPSAVATAERRALVTGRSILVPTPALLFACKLEAWRDRGTADPYGSKDLEDLVALLDGCRELEQSIATAAPDVRQSIAAGLGAIWADAWHREAALGHLPRGGDPLAQEARVRALVGRLTAS